jgi:hypothetical protein
MAPLSPDLWVELVHVQLAMPSGAEEIARRVYVAAMGSGYGPGRLNSTWEWKI